MTTVVVLGGYGRFGQIICRRLAAYSDINLVVAGRNEMNAATFASAIGASSCSLRCGEPGFSARLCELGTDVIVNCAGPFQGAEYIVAKSAIEAHAHYVDIADAREFVCNISTLDTSATAAGVVVISGASSVPALSSAVVDAHRRHFLSLQRIDTGISASEQMPGAATVAAVLSYVGREFPALHDGRPVLIRGWQGLRREQFAPPAGRRWLCHCDVPDLQLFPARYRDLSHVSFSAGLGLSVTHLGLWLLAALRRVGVLRRPERLAGLLRRAAVRLERFGNGVSAMFVSMSGTGLDGEALTWRWELLARNNDGANIPCLAAVALCKRIAAGKVPLAGARPCVGELTLDDFIGELADMEIVSRSTRC